MKGLVFSGGGVRGAFSAGAVTTLKEEYDFYSGISVGALIAFVMAHHKKTEDGAREVEKLWKAIKKKSDIIKLFKPWPPNMTWLGPFRYFWEDGIYITDPLRDILNSYYDPEKLKRSGKKLAVGFVDKTTGKYVEADEKECDIVDYVLASASFPIALTSVFKEDKILSDGGHITLTPIKSAINAGCEKIDIVMTGPFSNINNDKSEYMKNIWNSGVRTLDIMLNSMWQKDLKECHRINEFIREGVTSEKYRYVDINVYAPDKVYPYFPLEFRADYIAEMMKDGYNATPVTLGDYIYGKK